MKYNSLFILVLLACFSTCLIVFPSGSTEGVMKGLQLCYLVIIPSLFPFTVCALILFDSNIFSALGAKNNSVYIDSRVIYIFIISCIGGYPVGAKLIEKLFSEKEISRTKAEAMLYFCVNSGPTYIIIAIGTGLIGNRSAGIILFFANLLSATTLGLLSFKNLKPENKTKISKIENKPFSDLFVDSTYDATQTMIGICAFVVLFSSILGLINEIIPNSMVKTEILSLFEITNGIANSDKNIYQIAFLIGFAGFCVHFQVLSVCKKLKPGYLKFLISRTVQGGLCSLYTYLLLKIFGLSLPAIAPERNFSAVGSEYSPIFSVALILLSILFMMSMKKSYKTI